jgi:6-phosphogluconolactonase
LSATAAPDLTVWPDLDGLARAAAERVSRAAAQAIAERGRFRLALAGGSTPRALYRALASAPGSVDWTRTDLFFGDERAVPPDDPLSNYRMARETLLDPARVPAANVHRMPAEAPDLDGAARAYEESLRAGAAPPWLDLALLGLGPDGHTASLFPESRALDEQERLCVAADAPVAPLRRLTLTYPALAGARQLLFLIAGPDKAQALRNVVTGPERSRTWPAQPLARRGAPAAAALFCDREAASLLPSTRSEIR